MPEDIADVAGGPHDQENQGSISSSSSGSDDEDKHEEQKGAEGVEEVEGLSMQRGREGRHAEVSGRGAAAVEGAAAGGDGTKLPTPFRSASSKVSQEIKP